MYASTGCSGYSGVTGFDAQHEDRAAELRARQQRDEPARSRTSAPEYPQYPHSTRTVPAQYPHSTPAAARRAGVIAHAHTDTHLRTQAHTSTHARATFVRARRGFAPARDVLVLRGYSKGYGGGPRRGPVGVLKGYCAGTVGVLEGVLWGYSRGTVAVLKGYCGGTHGASYYKHGTGPAAPARDVLMLGRRRELLPRDRLADLRRRAEDSSTAKSGTGGVRRRATW